MKLYKILFLLFVCIGLLQCRVRYFKPDKNKIYHISSVNQNVCKTLKGKTVLYAVFVDSKYTSEWTEFDLNSTIDSINVAIEWIEQKATESGINLDIVLDYHQNEGVLPIEMKLPKKTLSGTLFSPNGVSLLDRWADKVSKEALKAYGKDTSTITKAKIKPLDREKLLARLRDKHQTDNVGLVFFINNFFSDEISVVLNAHSNETPEYGIISWKQTGVIAHEYLHLFGAADLYLSPFDKGRLIRKKKEFAMKEFPNEIMAFPHRRISTLEISDFTKYLIGWKTEMNQRHKDLLIGKKLRIARY